MKTILSYNYIINNIIRLEIHFNIYNHISIKGKSFELINNLKLIKYLFIKSINLDKPVDIELNNLKLLLCSQCENIKLSNIKCKKLKMLYYVGNNLSNLEELNSDYFKELRELDLECNKIKDKSLLEFAKWENLIYYFYMRIIYLILILC